MARQGRSYGQVIIGKANPAAFASAGATVDDVPPQMTAMNEGFYGYDDEAEGGYDTSGFTSTPNYDVIVNDITMNSTAFETVQWDGDDDHWEPGWAQAPPTSLGDETGETTGRTSNNDWVDEDEPVTDGWTQVVTTDQFDETGQTTGRFSNEDWVDEDEPIVQDWIYFQADENFPVLNNDITGTSFADIYDDDEPVTDGWLWAQYDETLPPTDTAIGPQELGQVYDDDEPIVEFWTQVVPTDQFDETGQTTGGISNNDWVDEDEPVTDGWLSFPPDQDDQPPTRALLGEVFDEDEPIVEFWTQVVPTDQFDETGETTGSISNNDWVDEDELADGWLASPLDDAPLTAAEVGPQELGQVWDDDEDVTDGFLASPLEDTVAFEATITGKSNNDWVDEDEDVTDGFLCSPLHDIDGITATANITMPLMTTSTTALYGIANLSKRRILPPRKHASLVSSKSKLPTDSLAMMQSVNDALTGTTTQRMVSGVMSSVSEVNLGGLQVYVGSGVPQFAAAPGSIFLNISGGGGSTMYVKESLAVLTNWTAK